MNGARSGLPFHLFTGDALSCKNQAKRRPHVFSFFASLNPFGMSALCGQTWVRLDRPLSAISERRGLFDHLVSAGEERLRDRHAERLCSFQVDDQIGFG